MTQESCFTRDPLLRTFGAVLRSHREGAGLSRPQLAEALGCGAGWIEKLETAQKPPSEATADDLDVFFETANRLFWVLWREIKREGKHLAAPAGFAKFTELEAKAKAIHAFEVQLIPGLLQTPGYARAVMSTGQPPDLLDEYVSARMRRQEIVDRADGPRLWFVLDEALLRRPIGGPEVMREQLARLIEVGTSHPRVEIRVLPFSSVSWAAIDGSFEVLSLPGGTDYGYHEGPEISQVIEDQIVVAEYRLRFAQVMGESLRTGESLTMIEKILEEYA